ncbi:MAG: hypothetical protein KC583_00670, partial [Myxococcales bacterium]|nr:hypothetical protein [Myxococcales bacterium]
VDADANPIHGFPFTAPTVPLRMAVEALRIDSGTPVEFIVYSAAEDAELDRVQGTVEDGVCVAIWTLQQQPGLQDGVYFTVDVADTNGPIRSPVIKARAGFSFSDSLGDDVQAELPAPRFDLLQWTDADEKPVEVFAADLAPQTLYLAAKPAFVPAGSDLEFTIHRIEDDLEVGTVSATVGGAHVRAEWTLEAPVAAGHGFYFVAFHPAMDAPARGPEIKARARFALSDNTPGVIVPIPQPPKHEGALSGPRWQTRDGQPLDKARQGHDTPCRLWVKAANVSPGKAVTFTVRSLPGDTVLQVLTTKVKAQLDGVAWVDWEVPAHAQGAGLVFDAVVDGLDPLRSDTLELVANFAFSDNTGD